jgi:hypothetical protein
MIGIFCIVAKSKLKLENSSFLVTNKAQLMGEEKVIKLHIRHFLWQIAQILKSRKIN